MNQLAHAFSKVEGLVRKRLRVDVLSGPFLRVEGLIWNIPE